MPTAACGKGYSQAAKTSLVPQPKQKKHPSRIKVPRCHSEPGATKHRYDEVIPKPLFPQQSMPMSFRTRRFLQAGEEPAVPNNTTKPS
jgi:hypothetical protein